MSSSSAFAALGISEPLVNNLLANNITAPTPVQADAIPVVLAGRDLIAVAPTGTGKTAAFLLPAMERILAEPKQGRGPRLLVLAPTRELASQTAKAAVAFSRNLPRFRTVCITGGESYQQQGKALAGHYEILVATPGRLIDQLESGRIDFSRVEMLVLDEADRMLDIGFTEAVLDIAGRLPVPHQTVCFTATINEDVTELSAELLVDPHHISVGGDVNSRDNIEQQLVYVDDIGHKHRLLQRLLGTQVEGQAIVFTATRRDAEDVATALAEAGESAVALHGELNQRQRTRTLNRLRSGEARVLVATDVAARGIDVAGLSHVINFDLPKFAEDYVHRIGRTGRAGASGIAVSFVGNRDIGALRRIERLVGAPIGEIRVEGFEASFHPGRQRSHGGPRDGRPQQGRGRGFGGGNRDGGRQGYNGNRQGEGRRDGGYAARGPRRDDRPQRSDDRQPRFDDRPRRDDRAPRFAPQGPRRDDRPARFDDRQPRFDDRAARDERPSRWDERQPDYNDDNRYAQPPRRGGNGGGRGQQGQRARTGGQPGNYGNGGGNYGNGGNDRPRRNPGRNRQVGVYQIPAPNTRGDWRNERLSDQKPARKPVIIKANKGRAAPSATGDTGGVGFNARTLRLKKAEQSDD
jgi:superfamily II DNA/RNA helicase